MILSKKFRGCLFKFVLTNAMSGSMIRMLKKIHKKMTNRNKGMISNVFKKIDYDNNVYYGDCFGTGDWLPDNSGRRT
jgi:hypothetical protein